jgi:hypothetical protein
MPPKGITNNPNGRPVGSKNERTKEWEALAESIIGRHAEGFNHTLSEFMKHPDPEMQLKGCQLYLQALEYFKPKQARVTHAGDVLDPVIIQVMPNV